LSNTREISTKLLSKIYQGNSLENSVLLEKNFLNLEQRDKSFVLLILLNTLRRNGQIDSIISKLAKKPFKNDSFLRNLLRISISQILFLDIPDYSTVNIAVEISKKYGSQKFVNAILRNVCRNKKDVLSQTPNHLNIPNWVKKDILDVFGHKNLDQIALEIAKEPLIDIRIKSKEFQSRDWEKTLNGKKIFNNLIRIQESSNIESLPYFKEGSWWVQGLSATFPATIIDKVFEKFEKSKVSILDVGAAPGGKTFQLLDSGYNVTSIEISKRRINKMEQNLNRLDLKTKLINQDFFKYKTNDLFDCILIDAPCSASGLMQKKPEILLRNKDIQSLVEKQRLMLKKASTLIKKGGYIIYSVCSILSEEGKNQIQKFLIDQKSFSFEDVFGELKKYGKILNNKGFLTLPFLTSHNGGIDGFFITCLKRNKL
tara:strand:- start:662 stop:1945 length:1284 start_codon:yes stop_codon:yes gene_type:complete